MNGAVKKRNTDILLWLGWMLVAYVLMMQFRMGADADKSWLLHLARKVLAGKRLYVDLFEPNPPLIVWLYELPVMLGNVFGVEDFHMLVLMVSLLTAASLALCAALLKQHESFADAPQLRRLHTLLLAAVTIFWVNSVYFGDREHIFFVCTLPYIFLCMPGLAGRNMAFPLRLAIGLMAMIGFCMKPHTLLVFIAVQLMAVSRERSLKPIFCFENWMIGGAWLAYLAAIYCIVPEFFTVVIPMELATYSAYKNSLIVVLLYMPAILTLSIGFSEFRLRYRSPYHNDILYFLGLCLAAFVYVIVNNGWLYTFYPLNSLVLLSVSWAGFEFAWLRRQGADNPAFGRGRAACIVMIFLNVVAALVPYVVMGTTAPVLGTNAKILASLEQIVAEKHFTSFGSLSLSSSLWPRLERKTHAAFVTRFHDLWMLPKFAVSDEVFSRKNEWILANVAKGFAADLAGNRPDVVFVDISPKFGIAGKPYDMVAMMAHYDAFTQAWGHYALMQTVDFCDEIDPAWKQKPTAGCRFDVYKRMP